jgi:hypothetical protein
MKEAILLTLLLYTGCGIFTRTRVEYVKVPAAREPCLKHLPEPLHPWTFDAGGEGKCDGSYEACLSPLDAAALDMNYRALIRRIADDWALCGVK